MFRLLIIIIVLSFPVFSQTIKVRSAGNGKAKITSGKTRSIIDLSDDIEGCLSIFDGSVSFTKRTDITEFRLLDSVKKAGFYYLLIQAPAEANCNVQSYCGAAQDNTLIWLKLNNRLKVVEKQAVVIEDCQKRLYVNIPKRETDEEQQDLRLKLQNGKLEVESEKTIDSDTEETEVTTVSYNRSEAEKGLITKTEKRVKQ